MIYKVGITTILEVGIQIHISNAESYTTGADIKPIVIFYAKVHALLSFGVVRTV